MNPLRITFYSPQDEHQWPPASFERVWATKVGPTTARIDNVPFFTKQATLGDVIEFSTEPDGVNTFVRIMAPSDNSLVRILLHARSDFDRVYPRLEALGCLVEGHVPLLMLAVSIPRSVGLQGPMNWLVELENDGILEYEEAIIRLPDL